MLGLRSNIQSRFMVKGVVAALLVTQLTACGTILYPERRGQASGSVDVGVAVLDAIGLLFFFVPGVVAFGVDFATGAIYLPGGKVAQLTPDEVEKMKGADNKLNMKALKDVMAERGDFALSKDVQSDKLQAVKMKSKTELLAALNLSNPTQRVAQAAVYN